MEYFILHESVRIVEGAKRAALYDLTHGLIRLVPKDMAHVIRSLKKMSLHEYRCSVGDKNATIVDSYLEELVNWGYGLLTKERAGFTERDDTYEAPWLLHNAIIECDHIGPEILDRVVDELILCRCQYVEIRHYQEADLSSVAHVMSRMRYTGARGIRLVVPHLSDQWMDEVRAFVVKDRFIYQIIVHGCPDELPEPFITKRKERFSNALCCGRIDRSDFIANYDNWTLSRSVNSCLHGKLSFDQEGNIRMCPASSHALGKVGNSSIVPALAENLAGSKEWNMTKDAVIVCRDCEFRYACTDCRMIRSDPSNIASKPLKCGYDPYTATWNDWQTQDAMLTLRIMSEP